MAPTSAREPDQQEHEGQVSGERGKEDDPRLVRPSCQHDRHGGVVRNEPREERRQVQLMLGTERNDEQRRHAAYQRQAPQHSEGHGLAADALPDHRHCRTHPHESGSSNSPIRFTRRCVHHLPFELHGPQLERTINVCSGLVRSLVLTGTQNSWYPPIPACIMNSSVSVVEPPGLMVVCPTTAAGGQQPALRTTRGASVRRREPSPALLSVKTTRAGVSNR